MSGQELSDADFIPRKTRNSRFVSPTFMQVLMLLNGLILTGVAFFLLNIFVARMLHDEYDRVTTTTLTRITDGLSDLSHSLETVVSLLSLDHSTNQSVLVDNINIFSSGLAPFDRVVWVYQSQPGIWQFKNLYTAPDADRAGFDLEINSDFIIGLIDKGYFKDTALHTVSDFDGMEYVVESETPESYSRPFALIKALDGDDYGAGLVIGLTRVRNVFGAEWLFKEMPLSRFAIRDLNTNERIYHLNRSSQQGGAGISKVHIFKVGETPWELSLEFEKQDNEAFLEKTPYFVLIFGLLLTLGGMAYVRNNQKQAKALTAMNIVLEGKNTELEKEVGERERLNRAIRRAERENRAIIDAVSDIIFETNTDGEILFLNATWRKITGFEPEQFKKHNLFNMLHPQDQERQRKDFDALVRGHKQAYRTFTRLRTADGTFRSVELAMSMMRHDENKNMRVVGTFTDVEERRRAERALSEAEKKYRTIVENAAGGIYQVTPDGLYLSANIAMARILGYENREDIVRINADRSVYVDSRGRELFKRELEDKGFINNRETRVQRSDGSLIWINENARVVRDETGSVLYYEGSIEDITKRKESEIAMREAKVNSDLANRAKSDFLANMSHELRTPLNAIIGFSEIMAKEVLGPIGNKAYNDYARDIHQSGSHLLKIINEILDISRIDAGDRQLNESVVDMAKVVGSALELMAGKVEEGHKTIHNRMGALPKVVGEEIALKQVLLNLLSNAIKFTPSGGMITLTSEIDPDGHLRLSVTDTGIGLDPREIEKALSPFGQLDNNLAREEAGAGLGLTLVMALMKLHGGKFELFSEKGVGTTATIVIPVERVEVRPVSPTPSTPAKVRQF